MIRFGHTGSNVHSHAVGSCNLVRHNVSQAQKSVATLSGFAEPTVKEMPYCKRRVMCNKGSALSKLSQLIAKAAGRPMTHSSSDYGLSSPWQPSNTSFLACRIFEIRYATANYEQRLWCGPRVQQQPTNTTDAWVKSKQMLISTNSGESIDESYAPKKCTPAETHNNRRHSDTGSSASETC